MILAIALWTFLRALVGEARTITLENAALRHQPTVPQHSARRPRLTRRDRVFWVWLVRLWGGWRSSLVIVPAGDGLGLAPQGFRL